VSTRPVTAGVLTAAAQAQITALLFVELNFSSGFLRLTTAGHDVAWNGYTWTGVGLLGSVEAIREDTTLQAIGIKLGLSGVDTAVISIALQEDYQGRAAKIWCAFVNVDTGAIIADPLLVFVGRMDHMTVVDGTDAAVQLQLENELAAWDKPRIRRFSDADQRFEYPSDKGFEFIAETANRVISWGRG
jgi:hypothetical protein